MTKMFIDLGIGCLVSVLAVKPVDGGGEQIELHSCSSASGGAFHFRVVRTRNGETVREKSYATREQAEAAFEKGGEDNEQ